MFIKAKYIKLGNPSGISYTFKTEDIVTTGDMVETTDGKHLFVVDEAADLKWVETYGADKIGTVKKVVVESEDK